MPLQSVLPAELRAAIWHVGVLLVSTVGRTGFAVEALVVTTEMD